jgi:hypothetical protein
MTRRTLRLSSAIVTTTVLQGLAGCASAPLMNPQETVRVAQDMGLTGRIG